MTYEIDKKTVKLAKLCGKGVSCLKSERDDLCKVRLCIEGKIHFIECMNEEICAYQKDFGGSKYCDCPVRKEIYNKYKE